jgi:hypothetical protein
MSQGCGTTGHRGESTNAPQALFVLNGAVNAGWCEGIRLRSRYVARRPTLILLALALVFGASACGDDSSDEFKDQYNQAVRPLSSLGEDIGDSLSGAEGQSNQALGAQFEKLAERAEQTRRNLAELEPPEDASDQFDELLASLKTAVADLRAVGESAREGDPAEAAEATQSLVESGQRVQEAEADFKDAVEG